MGRKGVLGVIGLASLAVLGWFGYKIGTFFFSADARYAREVRAMREQIVAAMDFDRLGKSMDREERGRVEVLQAVQTALANAQCQYGNNSREKVRAIATELKRSAGELLHTRKGAYRLWTLLEEACPLLRDYAWMQSLRQMQQEGWIPRFDEAPPNPADMKRK